MPGFRRTRRPGAPAVAPATGVPMTGTEAVVAVERALGARLHVHASDAVLDVVVPPRGTITDRDAARLLARAAGAAAAGDRVAVVLDAAAFDPAAVARLAERGLPLVVHLACADSLAGRALVGAHAATGVVVLQPGDPQEAADLALAARRIAELALAPVVVVHDARAVGAAARPVALPDAETLRATAGSPDDRVEPPTPAQRDAFGPERRRIPRRVDPLWPAGIGAPHGDESAASAALARARYASEPCAAIVADVLAGLAGLTGRELGAVSSRAVDDAELVVVVPPAFAPVTSDAADALRRAGRVRAGVVAVRVASPWPAATIGHVVGDRRVAVFDAVDRVDAVADAIDAACGRRAVASRIVPLSPSLVLDADALADAIADAGGEVPRPRIAVGLRAGRALVRYPVLQAFEQRLRREAPDVARELFGGPVPSIPPEDVADVPEADAVGDVVRVLARRSSAPHAAAATLLRALDDVTHTPDGSAGDAAARPVGGSHDGGARGDAALPRGAWPETSADPLVRPAALTLAALRTDRRAAPRFAGAALVTDADLLDDLAARDDLARGATVFVAASAKPAALAASLSRRTRRWLRRRALRLVHVDLARALEATTAHPTFADQLAVWTVIGAWLAERAGVAPDAALVREAVARRLCERLGESHYLVDDVRAVLEAGAAHRTDVAIAAGDDPPVDESPAPWTVTDAARDGAPPLVDAVHFWQAVGYLYEHGDAASVVPDAVLAGATLPARTGAFHDRGTSRVRAPRWLPEACTGCALCWAHCPDSALPARLLRVEDLVALARRRAERGGAKFVQLTRLQRALVRQATRAVLDASVPPRADAVLRAAFDAVSAKLDEAAAEAARGEMDALCDAVAGYPVARTSRFFDVPESASAGDGALLAITPDPHACTACGVCISVCDDGALEWEDETPERRTAALAAFGVQRDARTDPALLERHGRDGAEGAALDRLLDVDVFHAMVGGGSPLPGGGPRSALRLVLAGAVDAARERVHRRIERLDALVRDLESAIQGRVDRLARINDFDAFARRLDRVSARTLDASTLGALIDSPDDLERDRLERLTRALERVRALRDEAKAAWPGPVLVFDAPSARLWGAAFPYNPLAAPWLALGEGEGTAAAPGLADALHERALEAARTEVEAARARDDRAPLEPADERAEAETLAEPPPVIAVGDATAMHLDDVDAFLAQSSADILVAIDRVGVADDLGDPDALDVLDVARRHPGAFVAATSIGEPAHLLETVRRAVAAHAPAFVRVYAPDPERCGLPPERIALHARLAVAARVAPLVVREPNAPTIDLSGNPDPDAPFAREAVTLRRSDGTIETETLARTPAHWVVEQARFADAIGETVAAPAAGVHVPVEVLATAGAASGAGAASDGGDPSPDAAGDDDARVAIVTLRGRDDRRVTVAVSRAVGALARRVHARWEALRAAAAGASAPGAAAQAPRNGGEGAAQFTASNAAAFAGAASAGASAASDRGDDARERLVAGLLRLCGADDDPAFFTRTLREFVLQRRAASAVDEGDGA